MGGVFKGWDIALERHVALKVILCHNTDLGDGWERAETSEQYYREYSLPKAYPMGVNIFVYALTR